MAAKGLRRGSYDVLSNFGPLRASTVSPLDYLGGFYRRNFNHMHMDIQSLYTRLVAQIRRLKEENGQDLVEYALIVAMIAFAAIVGMEELANGLNDGFNVIANTLDTYLVTP